ncbi:hypothetical protein KP509_05G004200 [Ceratopteris richardii]|uniref:Uncharacterized protein n=1 Tax=Ceratopteris richardii TaxID=49495 RepID=A0A8T2UQI0_CERRI|nr:hypothetical protein KP509_05G004200 [Ceratopteris richardii]
MNEEGSHGERVTCPICQARESKTPVLDVSTSTRSIELERRLWRNLGIRSFGCSVQDRHMFPHHAWPCLRATQESTAGERFERKISLLEVENGIDNSA